MIHEKEGIDRAIEYLEDKLRLFDYWPGVHMALLNFELGGLYREKGDFPAARKHWLCAVDAEPLCPENEHENRTKQMARNNLGVLEDELGALRIDEKLEEPNETKQVSPDVPNSVALRSDLSRNDALQAPSYQTCWTCNAEVELPASFCDMCGSSLDTKSAGGVSSFSVVRQRAEGVIESYHSLPEWGRVCIVLGVGLVIELLALTIGPFKADVVGFNILFLPLLFGATVSISKPVSAVFWVDGTNEWFLRKKSEVQYKDNYFSRFFSQPLFWGLTKIMVWSEKIDNQFTRSGVRITSYLYFAGLMLYLAFIVTAIVVGIFLLIMLVGLICWIISEMDRDGVPIRNIRSWSKRSGPPADSLPESVEKANFSDDFIVRDKSGREIGRMSKAYFSDDLIVRNSSGEKVGRISNAFFSDDRILRDQGGHELGRIKDNWRGERVFEADLEKFKTMLDKEQ